MKFGLSEYLLITRLNCGRYLEEKVFDNIRLISTYLNNSNIVRFHELEDAFAACNDKEDPWKLDLVYFVDGILYSHDGNYNVDIYLFSLVEPEDFFKYLFGTESFKRTLLRGDKDVVHLRRLC